MEKYKTLDEVKVGDTLYCLEYDLANHDKISIVPLTVKEVITNGPVVDQNIYSKEAIIIKEKVPNTPEGEGEFVIDQYYGGNYTHKYGIFTTYEEARSSVIEELMNRFKSNENAIMALHKRQNNIIDSLNKLENNDNRID